MKIAVTATGEKIESEIDPRFGRCAFFIIYDLESGDFQAVPNPGREASGGAGPQATQAVADTGVEAVITGNLGPNAAQALQAINIPVYQFQNGTVAEAIEKYKAGELESISGPTVKSHFGMNK